MIFKNSDYFSNQKSLSFFLAISLDLISPIVSKYVKFNFHKSFILSKQFWFCQLHLGSYDGKVPFSVFIFIFKVIYSHTCYVLSITVFYCGSLMLSGFDELAQWPLILFSKNKLISNASYKESLCHLKIRCVSFIIKEHLPNKKISGFFL